MPERRQSRDWTRTRREPEQNLAVVGQSHELGRVTVFEILAERRRYLDVERAYTEVLRAASNSAPDSEMPGIRGVMNCSSTSRSAAG